MNNIIFRQCNKSNYTIGRTSSIKYIVVHYTANNGDTAAGNANYFANNRNLNSSAHYFVDEYDTYYQSVKDNDTAWHCGASKYKHALCRNNNSIGVELCSRKTITGKYYFKEETIANAIELIKYLMNLYGVSVENVVRHYDVTGKACPKPFVNNSKQWNDFKQKLTYSESNDEEVSKIQVSINEKYYSFDRILKDNKNYLCLSDFKQAGFDVGYSEATKIPSFGVKSTEDTINVNGVNFHVNKILKNGENYVKLRDLASALGVEIQWDDINKQIIINGNK